MRLTFTSENVDGKNITAFLEICVYEIFIYYLPKTLGKHITAFLEK